MSVVLMRLNERQIRAILEAVKTSFGDGARVYLFGSRLDDHLKGGDIDLLVDLPAVDHDSVRHTCQAIAGIQLHLGEQKIDIIVRHPESPDHAIYHQALNHGVLLNEPREGFT